MMTARILRSAAPVAGLAAALIFSTALWGVSTSHWVQTNESDFREGTFDNVVATNLGDLKLSRAVKTLLEQDPRISSVNALAEGPDGTIYAGTGPQGILLRIKDETAEPVLTLKGGGFIFSLAFEKSGALLIATGGDAGRVLRLEDPAAGGEPAELFKAQGVQYVWSVRVTADGLIYAATGPTGQLYEIKPDGKSRVLLDTTENNILSLIADDKDFLYAGTDPNGLIYRINRRSGEAFILYDAVESEISALALDARGNLYAGTAEARDGQQPAQPAPASAEQVGRPEGGGVGVPLPSEEPSDPEPPTLPDPNPGQPEPIPQAPAAQSPFSIGRNPFALGADGVGDAGDGGNAEPSPGGEAPAEPAPGEPAPGEPAPGDPPAGEPAPGDPAPGDPSPQPGPNPPPDPAPAVAGAGETVPGRQPPVDPRAAGEPRPEGNAVYRIDREGFVSEIFRQPVLVLAIAERQGTLLLATGSEGNIYQVNPAAEETVVLAKVNPKQVMSLLPASNGRMYLGLANAGGIASMSPGFAKSGSYTSTVLDATQVSRFGKMQLRGLLPEGTGLKVSTRSGNVRDAAQKSWSAWTKDVPASQFVQVQAPSARFLQYRLTLTSEAGKASPVVEDVSIAYQLPNLAPQVKSIRLSPIRDNQSQQQGGGEAEPVRIPSAQRQQVAWEASDPNGDNLTYSLYFRRGPGTPWILLKDKVREPQFQWDTRSVADGRYEVKVQASDAPSNPPGQGRGSSRVSDAIVVDNTPPVIGDVKWRQKGLVVEVELKAVDRSSVVAALDYSVDSSRDWQAILPADNIFDGPEETITLTLPGLAPGPHQVMVRATDAKGNQGFENVFLTVEGPAAKK